MTRPPSRSTELIGHLHLAALGALALAPGGQLSKAQLMQAIESRIPLDDWALAIYEDNGQTRWKSIFGFASVGLVKAGYVTKQRGLWTITDAGRAVMTQPPDRIAFVEHIRQKYLAWKQAQLATADVAPSSATASQDDEPVEVPEERIPELIRSAHEALAAELVETVRQCDPAFFERLVVKLLLKMGYGGSREEAGKAVGQSGDGGIDGVINEDRLGLDAIYVQAKRWEGSVGEGPIRDFKGALDARNAHKGVFITTSYFTPAAREAARNSRYRIVLIDGARLAELMIEHELGVSIMASYQLKRLDSDFFVED